MCQCDALQGRALLLYRYDSSNKQCSQASHAPHSSRTTDVRRPLHSHQTRPALLYHRTRDPCPQYSECNISDSKSRLSSARIYFKDKILRIRSGTEASPRQKTVLTVTNRIKTYKTKDMAKRIKKDTLHAKGLEISIYTEDFKDEYISLTDIAKYRNADDPRFIIQNWMRSRDVIDFLGI